MKNFVWCNIMALFSHYCMKYCQTEQIWSNGTNMDNQKSLKPKACASLKTFNFVLFEGIYVQCVSEKT